MTQRSFPFNNSDTWEDSWTKMARLWLGTGVIPGVLNELQCYADSTGMQVKVKSGRSWDLGHFYENDAELVLPIATAHATLARIDRVVRRLDWGANSIILAVLQGIPAASPVAPALTQVDGTTWEESIAQIRVDAAVTTIAAGKVTDERIWAKPKVISETKFATRDISIAGVQTITGLTGIPKRIEIRAGVNGGTFISVGSWEGDDGSQSCTTMYKNTGNVPMGGISNTNAVSCPVNESNSLNGIIQNVQNGQFDINWTKVGAPTGIANLQIIAKYS